MGLTALYYCRADTGLVDVFVEFEVSGFEPVLSLLFVVLRLFLRCHCRPTGSAKPQRSRVVRTASWTVVIASLPNPQGIQELGHPAAPARHLLQHTCYYHLIHSRFPYEFLLILLQSNCFDVSVALGEDPSIV